MRRNGLFKKAFQGAMYRILYPLMVAALLLSMPGLPPIHATKAANKLAWASPDATALKRVGPIGGVQNQPGFLSNLDCVSMTYRMVGSSTMQTGCFTPTAFGMLDSSSDTVIFNGTDEGLPLLSYWPQQVLVPWPKALNMLTLDAANTGGSYIGMYKNPLASLRDQRGITGQLTSKQLTAAPEISFKDQSGHLLVVNPQTMAFSDGGSWLVVETLGGSFVRINLATLDMTAFAQAFGSQGSPGALLQSQVAVSSDGRFVTIENKAATSFKVYDLATCGSNVTSWQTSGCQSHEYWPFVSQQVAGLQSIRHVRFINNGLLSFEATSTNSANSAVYELAPTGSITSLTDYIGLGDSYTSGEGAFDYLSGTDTADNTCHLSANSYPLLLTRDLFSAAGGHSVACSGAVINDLAGTGGSYRGQVRHGLSLQELETSQADQLSSILANYSPGYVPQQLFVKQYQPRVITASIGGNDVGFGDILQKCVVPHISRHISDGTCYNTYESRMELVNLVNRTVPRWTALYQQLQAASPGTTVYAVGYPSIASDTGQCPLNVNLGKSELEFAEELIHYLNGAIQQAATSAGVSYVDISQALAGHRLCEASGNAVAVNGLTAGNDFGAFGVNVLGRESYHPNALGHELIEQAILQKTHNLTDMFSGETVAVNNSQTLLNAPKSGRPISTLVPDTVTSQLMRAGTSAAVQVDGPRDGLQANGPYAIRLDGSSGTILASLTSDYSGNLSGAITMPANTAPGGHTIDITGVSQAGELIDITQPIYVADSPNDADGDGVANVGDSCPYAVNSGQDVDQDGIDDVCDGAIGAAPADTGIDNGESGGSDNPETTQTVSANETSQPVAPASSAQPAALHIQISGLVAGSEQPKQEVLVSSVSQSIKRVLGVRTGQPAGSPDVKVHLSGYRPPPSKEPGGHQRVSGSDDAATWPAYGLWAGVFLLLPAVFYRRRRIIKYLSRSLRIPCNIQLKKMDYKNRWSCFTIVIMRKFGVAVFSVVLFVSLLALAFSTSSNIAFTHPGKIEQWLSDSNLYGAFVSSAIDQAQKTTGTDQSGGISLSDTAVKQAAQSSFSSAALQQDVNTFLNSNYAWLNGKTAKPSFSIDLSGAKQSFAQKVGDYVKTYLAGLPACTPAQAAQINPQTADPLTLSCRPPNIDPSTEGVLVTQQIASSTEFLSNPVVTASNVNPNGSIQSPAQPYYQKFSSLPSAYQKATKIPWVAGVLTLLSLVAVIFVAPRKRLGLKAVTVTLALAGLVMVFTRFVSDQLFHTIEKHAFNASTVGALQKALTVFFRHAEDQLVKVDLWFGLAYLLLALVLLTILIVSRQKGIRIPKLLQTAIPAADPTPSPAQKPSQNGNNTPPTPKSRPPKPPRLVQ